MPTQHQKSRKNRYLQNKHGIIHVLAQNHRFIRQLTTSFAHQNECEVFCHAEHTIMFRSFDVIFFFHFLRNTTRLQKIKYISYFVVAAFFRLAFILLPSHIFRVAAATE